MAQDALLKDFLHSTRFQFRSQKALADRALVQVPAERLAWQPGPEVNSIAVTVQHLHGNMRSRWTDFLTADGEKPWRQRDAEFIEPGSVGQDELLARWEEGWACVFATLDALSVDDLSREVLIRGQKLTVIEALQRQIAHYGYHVGQLVMTAKMAVGTSWNSLSIPRGESLSYRPTEERFVPKS